MELPVFMRILSLIIHYRQIICFFQSVSQFMAVIVHMQSISIMFTHLQRKRKHN